MTSLLDQAYEHLDLLPVVKGGKACLVRHWNEKTFAKGHLAYHLGQGGNIGARVGLTRSGIRVLVVDRDAKDMDSWKQFVQKHGIAHRCNMVVDTASLNTHYWFRLDRDTEEVRTKIKIAVEGAGGERKKLPVDLKSTGYVLFPGSQINGRPYQFREAKGFKRPEDLAALPESVIDVLMSQKNISPSTEKISASNTNIIPNTAVRVRERATRIVCPERYVMRICSVQGSNGSGALVRALCTLRDSGWDGPRIFDFLVNVWNPACAFPEWSREEIAYAINRHCGEKR